MTELRINGAEKLTAVARDLKAVGNGKLKQQMNKRLRDIAKPLGEEALREGSERLPQRGGLGPRIAGARVRVSVRGGSGAAVRLKAELPNAWGGGRARARRGQARKRRAWRKQQEE